MKNLVFIFVMTFFLMALICPLNAQAGEIYTYTDKDGNTVISNTPIPEKYEKKAKKIDSYQRDSPEEIQRYETERKTNIQRQEAESRQKQQINSAQEEARKQQTNRAQEEASRSASHGTGCEIITFSQYERNSGGGVVVGGVVTGGFVTGGTVVGNKDTCVDLTIRNNDDVERNLTNTGIVAVTKKGNSRSPKGFMARIKPGGIYQGTACFGHYLSTISKLECKF